MQLEPLLFCFNFYCHSSVSDLTFLQLPLMQKKSIRQQHGTRLSLSLHGVFLHFSFPLALEYFAVSDMGNRNGSLNMKAKDKNVWVKAQAAKQRSKLMVCKLPAARCVLLISALYMLLFMSSSETAVECHSGTEHRTSCSTSHACGCSTGGCLQPHH